MYGDVIDQCCGGSGFWTARISTSPVCASYFEALKLVDFSLQESEFHPIQEKSNNARTTLLDGSFYANSLLKPSDSPQRAECAGDDDYYFLRQRETGSSSSTFCHPDSTSYLPYLGAMDVEDIPRKRTPCILDACERGRKGGISNLPDELLCEIFRFLPGARDRAVCSSVSMRWLMLQSHMHRDEFKMGRDLEGETDASVATSADTYASSKTVEAFVEHSDIRRKSAISERRVERQPQWAIGDLSRSLENKKATDVRLAAIAVGTGARGGLGKLCIRGGSLNGREKGVSNLGLSAIGLCCSALRTLSLWDCPYVGDEGLVTIGRGCRLLEKLDLLNCPAVGDPGIQVIARNCPLLSQISIEYCGLIGDLGVKTIGDCCTRLVSLYICECPLVGDEGLLKVVSNAKKLRRMKLHGIAAGNKILAAIGQQCKALVFLSLENLELITEDGFLSFGESSSLLNLKRLSISNCLGLTDYALGRLGDSCKGLKHLSLGKCENVTDQGLTALLQAATALEVLQLERCGHISNKGLCVALTSYCIKLKELQIKKCDSISDEGIASWGFYSCKGLKNLCLANCRHVGDKCLALIGQACCEIKNLDLSGLIDISDEGLLALLESGNNLMESINLSGCVKITDQAISAIAELCGESLQSFVLDGCKMMTDKSLEVIAKRCSNLQDLDISQCGITDQGVAKLLVKRGQGLSTLNLSGCSGITERILPLIAKRCKSLVGLNLKHCQGLSRKVLDSFESRLWKCQVFCS